MFLAELEIVAVKMIVIMQKKNLSLVKKKKPKTKTNKQQKLDFWGKANCISMHMSKVIEVEIKIESHTNTILLQDCLQQGRKGHQ